MPSHSPAAATMHQRHHGLQGPRPATLKVTASKADQLGRKRPQQQPVIIYVESPKVVHAQPSEFKSVVQRLTGAPPPSSSPSSSSPMLFSSAASLLPPPPQFPLQLYGQLPSSLWSTTTTVAAAPAPAASSLPADAAASVVRSLGFFINADQELIRPAAFLYDHQSRRSMVAAADGPAPAGAAANPLLLPSSLGACYHQGDLFVNQRYR